MYVVITSPPGKPGKKKKREKAVSASRVAREAVKGAITTVAQSAWQALTQDKEADQMAGAAKRMMKLTFGSPALRSIRFTVGPDETAAYEKKQQILKEQGKPHCVKIGRNMGLTTAVYMWTEMSHNRDDWITELQLSKAVPSAEDPEDPMYKDLASEGYVKFTHEVRTSPCGGQ